MEFTVLPSPDDTHVWLVIHSRPRCEKKVVDLCALRNIYSYLPLLKKKHKYGGTFRTYEIPLFTGYVFVYATKEDMTLLKQNRQVANVLTVLDQSTLVLQLERVKRALDNHETLELFPYFTEGMKVMVRSGPLKGVEGYINKLKTKTRIVLNIDFIQKAVVVEVDAEWLVPV